MLPTPLLKMRISLEIQNINSKLLQGWATNLMRLLRALAAVLNSLDNAPRVKDPDAALSILAASAIVDKHVLLNLAILLRLLASRTFARMQRQYLSARTELESTAPFGTDFRHSPQPWCFFVLALMHVRGERFLKAVVYSPSSHSALYSAFGILPSFDSRGVPKP